MKKQFWLILFLSIYLNANQKIIFTEKEKKWINNHKSINVGIYENLKPIEYINNEKAFGISWEYLTKVSKITGIKFIPVKQTTSKNALKYLKNETVMLISSRRESFKKQNLIYSVPYFYSKYSIILRSNELHDFSMLYLKDKRFAFVEKYQYHYSLKDIYKNSLKYIKDKDIIDALRDINNYKADFTVLPESVAKYIVSKKYFNKLSIIDNGLKPKAISFTSKQKNKLIIQIINKVINNTNKLQKFSIHKKWIYNIYNLENKKNITFTEDELNYLRAHSIIRYTGNPRWLPFESFTNDGKYIGIVAEYLKKLEKKLNVKFLKIEPESWSDALNMLKNGKVDLLSETSETPLRDKYIISNAYLSNPIGIVMNNKHQYIDGIKNLKNQSVALVKNYGYNKQIEDMFPTFDFIYVKDVKSGLKAVEKGKIDAFICSYAVANYQISKLKLNNIKIVGSTNFNINLAFVSTPSMSTFINILNKAISQMDDKDREKIIKRWIKNHAITHVDYTMAWIIAIFSLVLLSIIIYAYIKISRENERNIIVTKKLAGLNNRFESISNNMHGVIYECELKKDFTILPSYISMGSRYIFEITPEEVKSNIDLVLNLIIKEDLEEFNNLLKSSVANKQVLWQGRILLNGKIKWLSNTFIIKNRDNKTFIDGLIIDITNIKNYELDILEQKRKAELATKSKSEFLSNMSHEIRTPMNAIIGFTDLLTNTDLDKKQISFLSSIKTASKNLLRLINDILDLSKIEAKKIELNNEYIDIKKVLFELDDLFHKACLNKGLTFEIISKNKFEDGFYLDELRLRQILFNLISNAIKFTHVGGIKIEASYSLHKDSNEVELKIDVSDTGIGISKNQIHKIFQNFEQQDGQDSRKYGGTGLGLSISKKLAKLMNGIIKVKSEIDKGSTFSLILNNIKLGNFDNTPKEIKNILFKEAHILVVEDIKSNREVIQETLSLLGLSSNTAENGKIALDMINHETYDLVLMDVNMPVMNGFEALEEIRKNKSLNNIPVIAVSASAMKSEKAEIIQKGFDSFIAKPISKEEIQDVFINFLSYESIEKKDADENIIKNELYLKNDEIQIVKQEFLQNIEDTQRSGKLDDMKVLSHNINKFAEQNNITSLVSWSKELDEALEIFDIQKLEILFINLKKIIQGKHNE